MACRAPDRIRTINRLLRVVGEQNGLTRTDADDIKHGAPPHNVLEQNKSVHRPMLGFQSIGNKQRAAIRSVCRASVNTASLGGANGAVVSMQGGQMARGRDIHIVFRQK